MSSNARRPVMKREFKVGEHVTWNSEAGHVSGTIIKVHTKNVNYKGYTHHASEAEPQYEIHASEAATVRNRERQDRPHRVTQGLGVAKDERLRGPPRRECAALWLDQRRRRIPSPSY